MTGPQFSDAPLLPCPSPDRHPTCPGHNPRHCPAHKKQARGGMPCRRRAGAGTEHLGYGLCTYHGGNAPGGQANADKARTQHLLKEARQLVKNLGIVDDEQDLPDVQVVPALLLEAAKQQAAVRFCEMKVAALEENRLADSVWLKLLADTRKAYTALLSDLVKHDLDARALSIKEREVDTFEIVVRRVLERLGLADPVTLPDGRVVGGAENVHWVLRAEIEAVGGEVEA